MTAFCDVCVVVPAYRAEQTIGRTLESIRAQTLKPRQVVVVDDGSDDATFAAASRYIGDMQGIDLVVLRQDNQGPGAARNRAIAEATTVYLAFLDADDSWLAEKLERTMAVVTERDFALVAHDMIAVAADGSQSPVDCARHHHADDDVDALYRRGYVATSTVVAPRQNVVSAGGFDAALGNAQDFDLWLKLLGPRTARFRVFPGAYTHHYRMAHGVQSFTERRLRCTMEVARRHRSALRGGARSRAASVAFRVLAVHAEAVIAHWSARRPGLALWAAARLPAGLVRAAAWLAEGSTPASNAPTGETGWKSGLAAVAFVGWSAVVLAGYYANNYQYYALKIRTFLSFLF